MVLCNIAECIYFPIITKPTRITDHSATLINHIWINKLHEAVSGLIEVTITDHYPTFFSTYLNIDLTGALMRHLETTQ